MFAVSTWNFISIKYSNDNEKAGNDWQFYLWKIKFQELLRNVDLIANYCNNSEKAFLAFLFSFNNELSIAYEI